ncbi:DUF4292 domain-containing protein [candidate division KSB1 bacterium]
MNRIGFEKKLLFTAVLCGLCISSCAVFRIGSGINREWESPEEQLSYYNNSFSKLETLQAEGSLLIESSQFNERIPLKVLLKMPDSLKVVLEGLFGVDIAHFFLNKEQYLLYLPREETDFSGDMESLDLDQLLYDLGVADIDFQGDYPVREDIHREILGFFIGGLTLDIQGMAPLNYSDSTRTSTLYESKEPYSDLLFEFPRNTTDLESVQVYDGNEQKRIEKSYRRYSSSRGVRLPRQIQYMFTQERSRLTVRYTSIRINSRIDPEEFSIIVAR